MCLFQHEYLPPRQVAQQHVVQAIRGSIWSVVEDVCSEDTVFIRQPVIQPCCDVVLVHDLLSCKPEEGRVTQSVWCEASVRERKESEIPAHRRIYLYLRNGSVAVMNESVTHVSRRHGINGSNPLGLPQSFIVCKDERAVLLNGAAEGNAELVALERRDRRPVEKIAGIHGAVSDELIDADRKST